jgi:hypothetical protein
VQPYAQKALKSCLRRNDVGSWFEAPGCHHRISDHASATESATLITTLVTDNDKYEKDRMAALVQTAEE